MSFSESKRVGYVFSNGLLKLVNAMPRVAGRAERVHSLIKSYGLLNNMKIVTPIPATDDQLLSFHSSDYLEQLKWWNDKMNCCNVDEDESDVEIPKEYEETMEQYGFGYDCPLFKNLDSYCRHIAASSIVAADAIIDGRVDYIVNWFGGWHHAKRDSASGFCYINDIVLCITKLLTKFKKVLYIDLDLHHGDGVEEALSMSNRAMTLSFHKYGDMFFPGTGSIHDVGSGKAKFHSVNVPLKDGVNDQMFCSIFDKVFPAIQSAFPFDVVVCQSGSDSLSGDPMKSFNLTQESFIHVARAIVQTQKPAVFLGGGGYNYSNVARCWTSITAFLCGIQLDQDIPDHQFFTEYTPDFDLCVSSIPMVNRNAKEYVEKVTSTIICNLQQIETKQ